TTKAEKQRYSQLKKLRWTLLTNGAKRSDETPPHLKDMLAAHSDLAVFCVMKETLCALFERINPLASYAGWMRWYSAAEEHIIPALVKFAKLKRPRLDSLVAHAVFPIDTGKLKSFNNKIKVAKRIGFDYWDDDYFFPSFDISRCLPFVVHPPRFRAELIF
ncbi:MAG: transposase, partial [Clostridia bacterium]